MSIDSSPDKADQTQARVGRVLVSRDRIASRIAELAQQIAADLDGRPVTIAALMTGAMIFLADLIRHLPVVMRIHLIEISSYRGASTTSQGVQVVSPLPEDLTGQDVLIIDDILDSGRTLLRATEEIRQAGAARIRTCVLVRKPTRLRAGDGLASADYVGFDIPAVFVVGYGMDFNDYYRNLPDIAVLEGAP